MAATAEPTIRATSRDHNRVRISFRAAPKKACHIFVSITGKISIPAASVTGIQIAMSPILTVGKPRPIPPFTTPPARNTAATAQSAQISYPAIAYG